MALNVKTKSEKVIFAVVFAVYLLLAISIVFPFVWLGLNSFKRDVEFRADSFALPSRWIFANYYEALTYTVKGNTIVDMFINSMLNIVGIVGFGLFFSCCTAYILSKYHFKMREAIFNAALVIMIVPSIGSTATIFRLWHTLNIYDTYLSVFIQAAGGFSTGFLLLYATFKNISWTYAEAAFIDGASHFRVFASIMLPQAMPTIVSLIIINVIGVWNDYYTPFMYLPTKPTVAVGLFEVQSTAITQQLFPQLFALMLVSVVPILVLFVIMQNTIMENVIAGGIKG